MVENIIQMIEKRMLPGNWNPFGLLRPGQNLQEILENDKLVLKTLGTNSKARGSKLGELVEIGNEYEDNEPLFYHNYRIEIIRTPGLASCPWAREEFTLCTIGVGQKYLSYFEFLISNQKNKITLSGNSIMIHFIRDHGFFGGPNTKYRIEPLKLYSLFYKK